MDVIAMIAAERRQIADLVESLSPERLDTPSLCGSWTVREVAGHLASPFLTRPRAILPILLRSGFNLHRANARLAQVIARRPASELATTLRDNAGHRFALPVVGHLGQLTGLQVHGQDIRRPLGLPHQLQPERLRASLDFLVSRRAVAFGGRRLRVGLRFEATDQDWVWGTGPAVQGTAEALLLALTGRTVVLPELHGDGVPVLRDRLAS